MKTPWIFISVMIMTTVSAQVVVPVKYDFEKVIWGDQLAKIKKQFSKKNISEMKTSENPFAKKMEDKILYGYSDSINAHKVGILFQFTSDDSALQSIFLAFMKGDPGKNNGKENDTQSKEMLDILTKHYPSEFQERSIPMMGTVRIWSLEKTTVQAYLLPSMVSIILMKK